MNQSSHEVFSREETAVAGSDRTFGLVMAGALAAVTLLSGWHGGKLWPWTCGLAALFAQHHNSILFGNSMAALIGVLWIPWTAQLAVVMWQIEGSSPVLTIVQVIGGALTAWVFVFCPAAWAVAAFRPEIDPNTVRTLNDLGFMATKLRSTRSGRSRDTIPHGGGRARRAHLHCNELIPSPGVRLVQEK